ncbi:SNF2-related protein [Haloferula sp.]|uniref:SNF2-related protein n=1 Tax=Haloferula sp. TaxID=2497595 RepID=UPI003C790928
MTWTEELVRSETGWKAFREGKALAGRHRIISFKRGEDLLTGAFKEGKRMIRTVVRTGSALSVECACPANQATGEVCAHGVALLLTAISDPPKEAPIQEEPALKGELLACAIRFPAQLSKMLSAGRLSAQIERAKREPDQSDAAFSIWLARNAPGADFPKILSLNPDQMGDFLQALAGHSDLSAGGEAMTISEDRLAPLSLAASEHSSERIRLRLSPDAATQTPIKWGDGLGLAKHSEGGWLIGRLPVEPSSLVWRDEAAELMATGELEISTSEFFAEADQWLDLFQSPLPGWLGRLRFVPAVPQFTLELEGSLNALDATAGVSYFGNEPSPLSANRSDIQGLPKLEEDEALRMRDFRAEDQALRSLLKTGLTESTKRGSFTLRDPDAILSFLADDLPRLRSRWKVTLGSRLEHVLKSLHVIRPKLESSQDLAWELSFQTDAGKAVPEAKIREMLRSGRRSIKTSNGATVAVSREIPDFVEPLLADLGIATREGRIQADRAQDYLFREARKNRSEKLDLSDAKRTIALDIPEGLEVKMRAYQEEGFQWLVDRLQNLSGALLADEMGLGKTIQTIVSIAYFKQRKQASLTLVVVPTSLLGNWRDEFQRFAPNIRLVTLHGSKRDALRDEALRSDVVLTSYGTLTRDLAFHLRQDYDLLVVDEASLLRNPDSETSRSIAKIQARKRLALTGTPVENLLRDLWSIFRVVAPGYLGSKSEFEERYAATAPDISEGASERLRLRISPFVLRRTKAEVAKDLPEKIEIDTWLDLDRGSRGLYAKLAQAGLRELEELEGQSGRARMHLLTLLLRLRQLCLDPRLLDEEAEQGAKSEKLQSLIEERIGNNGKTLVFSQFRKYLHLIQKEYSETGIQVFSLDGSTRDRGALVKSFQGHDGPAVFFISLKAGGYGLNLTAADTVIHMDPWWNPAVEAQASDRAHRIGQTQPVTIYKLLTRDTVEERVRRMQDSKRAVIDSLSGDAAPGNWSESDIKSLLG